MSKPKVLFYDIETTPLGLWGFSLGKQVVRHGSLMGGYFDFNHIICLAYMWEGENKVHTLDWGDSIESEIKLLEDFDAIANTADVVIGKNSNRFDNKHVCFNRWFYDLSGRATWLQSTDDLEKHLRKNFAMPSYSLDYISSRLGLGGKDKMEFSDWKALVAYRLFLLSNADGSVFEFLFDKNIEQIKKAGEAALKKMIKYNKKDVLDTATIWADCKEHFEPRYNHALDSPIGLGCRYCGSLNITKNGTRRSGLTVWQNFYCQSHGGYAGRAPLGKNDKIGKIR